MKAGFGNFFRKTGVVEEEKWKLAILKGHRSCVSGVRWSVDGKYIVTTSYDKTVKVWSNLPVVGWRCVHTYEGHTAEVIAVAVSPDGSYIATASWDKTVMLWDTGLTAKAKLELQTMAQKKHKYSESALKKAKETKIEKERMEITETKETKEKNEKKEKKSVEKRACVGILRGHKKRVLCVAFNHTSKLVASGSWDSSIKLWSVEDKTCLHTFAPGLGKKGESLISGHQHYIFGVEFSPQSHFLATCSGDMTAKLWDITGRAMKRSRTYGLMTTYRSHVGAVTALCFRSDTTLKIEKVTIKRSMERIYHRPGALYTASGDSSIKIWCTQNFELLHTIDVVHTGYVLALRLSPCGRFICSGADDKEVKIWDLETYEMFHYLEGHTGVVQAVDYSPDGTMIASAAWDGTVHIWSADGRSKSRFKKEEGLRAARLLTEAAERDGTAHMTTKQKEALNEAIKAKEKAEAKKGIDLKQIYKLLFGEGEPLRWHNMPVPNLDPSSSSDDDNVQPGRDSDDSDDNFEWDQ